MTRDEVTFGVNDVYDIDSDTGNLRKTNSWTHGTALSVCDIRFVLLAAKLLTGLVILLALPASASSPWVLGYTAAFLCLAWTYSTPPLRLKERPIIDSLSNGLMCWLFWASGYIFSGERTLTLYNDPSATNGRLVFLYASALHSLAAVEDAKADASANQRTIVTTFGERFALLFSLVCLYVPHTSIRTGLIRAGSTTATSIIERGSLVSLATSAGAFTATVMVFVPYTRPVLVRLAFAGSYVGSILWVLIVILKLQNGRALSRDW